MKISYGSINEVEVLLNIGEEIGYINKEEYEKISKRYHILGKKTYSLIRNWK